MKHPERLLYGYVRVELRGASPERCLNRLSENGISFWNVEAVSPFALRVCVLYKLSGRAVKMAERSQCEAEILEAYPGIYGLPSLLKRPVLLVGLLTAILAVSVLPDYIWTVRVSGNTSVPSEEILRTLDSLGVRFGAKSAEIDSVDVKNRLLNLVDGLQWAAVNCSGGQCEVLVREREADPEIIDRRIIADVVAGCAGTVVELRVLQGEAVCAVGDTVEKGQILVSGITDNLVNLRTSRAQAEIYALTWKETATVIPQKAVKSGEVLEQHREVWLQLGRFRIKISGNSRICGAGCDKMINRKTMTLPGGYQFPVSVVTETCVHRSQEPYRMTRQEASDLLLSYTTRSVLDGMVGGTILSSDYAVSSRDGCLCFSGVFACREMIAREQEVNLFGSEQYGRTNSERRTD